MAATVLQLSDTHLHAAVGADTYGEDPDANLLTVLAAWDDEKHRHRHLDLCLVTGDVADDASSVGYERLRSELAGLGAPLLVLPGNHDDPARLAAVFGELEHVELGAWRVVPVDTSRSGDVHGTVDAVAVADELDRHDERPTVLALHHPPRSPSDEPAFALTGHAELLAALAARPNVRLVVSGHLHEPFERPLDGGATLLGAPSTCVSIRHDETGHHMDDAAVPIGARSITLHDDGSWHSHLVLPSG